MTTSNENTQKKQNMYTDPTVAMGIITMSNVSLLLDPGLKLAEMILVYVAAKKNTKSAVVNSY